MKTKKINVGKFRVIPVPFPENLDELRSMVNSEEDLFYLALRGFDQVRRTHLATIAKYKGTLKREVADRAKHYYYTHKKRFDSDLNMNQRD